MAAGTGSECGACQEGRRGAGGPWRGSGGGPRQRSWGGREGRERPEEHRAVRRGRGGANGVARVEQRAWRGAGLREVCLSEGAGPAGGAGSAAGPPPLVHPRTFRCPGRAQAAERRPHGALVHPREALPGLVRHAQRRPELVRERERRVVPGPLGLRDCGHRAGGCTGTGPCQFIGQQPVINTSMCLLYKTKLGY